MTVSANPFDLRTVLLARHAQHVVLIHFPIALYLAGVLLDLAGGWLDRETFTRRLITISRLPGFSLCQP